MILMKKLRFSALLFWGTLTFFACLKEQNPANTPAQEDKNYFVPDMKTFSLSRSSCDWTTLPAGSADALAEAIANTCEGGVIYLKSGIHTESQSVVIQKSVKIVGEAGAVLKVQSELSPVDTATGNIPVHAALHILNAPGTLIQDIAIEPLGSDGGAAILIENASQSAVIHCNITAHQFGIILEKSDRIALMRNTIVVSSAWQTGLVSDAHGIVVMNGKSAYASDNDISNALFGIWACDKWGTCERNSTHENYIGIILCKVPNGSMRLPGGQVTGAEFSATLWKTRQNHSYNNFDAGYLIIDGSNNNLLENNDGGNNATYDYEIVGDSYRFGFFTPFAFDNILYAKPGQTVKNCGQNSTVIGGVAVDTGVDVCQ